MKWKVGLQTEKQVAAAEKAIAGALAALGSGDSVGRNTCPEGTCEKAPPLIWGRRCLLCHILIPAPQGLVPGVAFPGKLGLSPWRLFSPGIVASATCDAGVNTHWMTKTWAKKRGKFLLDFFVLSTC